MADKSPGAVSAFLASLPAEKREVMATVRDAIVKKLPKGYEEVVQGKFIAYVVPFSRLADTYNGQPLCYAALAAQKNYFAIYLMGVYGDTQELGVLRTGFARAGKKLDMGKSCIRFKKLADLPLDVIAGCVARVPVNTYVARYQSVKRK